MAVAVTLRWRGFDGCRFRERCVGVGSAFGTAWRHRWAGRRAWSDSHGRIWVSYWNTGQVGMYDPATRAWKESKLPGTAHAYSVWVDDRDHVWLTDWSVNAIVAFDPVTEKFERYESNRANANVRQMFGRAGEAWGAESGTDRLVMVPAR